MTEQAFAWHPVPDINDGFGSISFSCESNRSRTMLVTMNGARKLQLRFTRVIAFQFEDDCPGNFKLPAPLPRLDAKWVFPLLRVDDSAWHRQWPMWPELAHYVLLSLDDLVQLIALPTVEARWED